MNGEEKKNLEIMEKTTVNLQVQDNSLKIFGIIANFVKELSSIFGKSQRSLSLYAHLIERTTLAHKKPIQKHVSAFKSFCETNKEAILDKETDKFSMKKIVYSTKVYIDLETIFKECKDNQTRNTIWEYLLTISALLDPTSRAKQVLKESKEKRGGREADFLGDIISKVEQNVDPNVDNPMAAVGSILSSGIFTDLISGMSSGLSDGSLDLSQLIGTVQNLVTGMNDGGEEGSDQGIDMVNTMMGTLNSISKGKVEEIDEK